MESSNDYVLQVKGNQPKLLKAIKETVSQTTPEDIDYTLEKNRGREEHRAVYVYQAKGGEIYNDWPKISYVIHVISSGTRSGRSFKENRYYITNKLIDDASVYNRGIRGHWGIENVMHWVKDVIQIEDTGMVKDLIRSENLSVIRNIVMNLYRISGHHSIKYAIERFTNKIVECAKLIHSDSHI